MSQSADERLVVMLEAKISDFEKRMRKAEATGTGSYRKLRAGSQSATRQMEADMNRSTTRINQALASTSSQIGSFARTFAMGFAGGVVAGAFAGLSSSISATIKDIAMIGDEAKRAGMAAEAFQEWKYVAEQNRIGIDALTDGFKELSLRADEFVMTGKGSAAEAFDRLGYSAADLKKKLKDPSALMLEIIGRMEGMDKAAQIRISDEIFGGTGGEQFVQLLDRGEAAIQGQIDRARELGLVMDSDMIAKAAALDAQFQELGQRSKRLWQGMVVDAAIYFGFIERHSEKLKFDPDKAARTVGENVAAGLGEMDEVGQDALAMIEGMQVEFDDLASASRQMVSSMNDAAMMLRGMGKEAEAEAITQLANRFSAATAEWDAGNLAGEKYAQKLQDISTEAGTTIGAMSELDRAQLSGVIGQVSSLLEWIGLIPGAAQQARAEINAMNNMAADGDFIGPRRPEATLSDLAPTTSIRPGSRPDNWKADMDGDGIPDAIQGGAGSAGRGAKRSGGAKKNQFDTAMEKTQREIVLLEAEAAAFLEAAAAGGRYAEMADYAKKRAELLMAAQEQGLTITPALTERIEAQARAFASAGHEAERAADQINKAEEDWQRGADALEGVFSAALDGADAAREAVANLIKEMAKVQFAKGMMGLIGAAGGGGFVSMIGGLLSKNYDGGGYTGNAPRSGGLDGKGGFLAMMHPRETVIDHTKGQTIAPAGGSMAVHVTVGVDPQTGNLSAFVDNRANQAATRMGQQINSALPARVQQIQNKPRMR